MSRWGDLAWILALPLVAPIAAAEAPTIRLDLVTYLGGDGEDGVREIAFDSEGFIVVAGHPAPPLRQYPQATTFGPLSDENAWVAKLTPDGSQLVWLTIVGGTGIDRGYGVALDREDNVYLAGRTSSLDFPTTPEAFDRTNNGGGCMGPHGCNLDGYVLKLSPDGRRLLYSTLVGGDGADGFRGGLAVDAEGAAYCVGATTATESYPGAVNRYVGGHSDGVIAKISPDGSSVVYARFVGSADDRRLGEGLFGVVVDEAGHAFVQGTVGGSRASTTADAFDREHNGAMDVYFAELSADGRQLLHGTFIGGEDDEFAEHGLVRDPHGNFYLVGQTRSRDFPVAKGHVSPKRGGPDGYVVKLGPDRRPVFTAVLGGSGEETALGPGVDARGNVFVTGRTDSSDFEITPNALDATRDGRVDTYLQIYDSAGGLLYSSYFGGSGGEFARFVTADPKGRAVLGGTTSSPDLPTTEEAFRPRPLGRGDAFLARFALSPAPPDAAPAPGPPGGEPR